jgi:hypothetical protein
VARMPLIYNQLIGKMCWRMKMIYNIYTFTCFSSTQDDEESGDDEDWHPNSVDCISDSKQTYFRAN